MPDPEGDASVPEARLAAVRARMAAAARRFGRDDGDVALVAVSKTFPPEAIEPFLAAGHRRFGENRVQEAKAKWPALRARFDDVALHLIGPLQTNKVREAVALFDVIETLDREKLAAALQREMDIQGRNLPVFVQVNVGAEPQKGGVAVADATAFVALCRSRYRLDVRGLMCIPPEGRPPGPYFALCAGLARDAGLAGLSMGMSQDYETAVAMGATQVRVGSSLFGSRPRPDGAPSSLGEAP